MKKPDYTSFIEEISPIKVVQNALLSEHTTFRIGGPADLLIRVNTTSELVAVLDAVHRHSIPFFILGSGANVLVSDAGFRGVVIKPMLNTIEIIGEVAPQERNTGEVRTASRRADEAGHRENLLSLEGLDHDDAAGDTLVRVGAGVSLPHLVRWSLKHGLTGLELFSGIPASVGGAIYNNIHGGTRLIVPLLYEIVLYSSGELKPIPPSYLEAGYNHTVLHESGEVVVEATFLLSARGDIKRARQVADEWKARKLKTQPQTGTVGCIFHNISDEDQQRLNWPTKSTGYLFDAILGWKGNKSVGGAKLSSLHANFIENDGTATAADVVGLIKEMKTVAKKEYNLDLTPEIFFVGFEEDPLG